jgi:hypothetical protein
MPRVLVRRGNWSWIIIVHINQEEEENLDYVAPDQIEDAKFPFAEKDDVRPFPEDFAMRGVLWSEDFSGRSGSQRRKSTRKRNITSAHR